jgi:hypothetical protein
MIAMIGHRRLARSTRREAPIRREIATHIFEIGQAVRIIEPEEFSKTADIYHITGRLPPQGNSPQYRIRNDDERHERVARQDSLEAITPDKV